MTLLEQYESLVELTREIAHQMQNDPDASPSQRKRSVSILTAANEKLFRLRESFAEADSRARIEPESAPVVRLPSAAEMMARMGGIHA